MNVPLKITRTNILPPASYNSEEEWRAANDAAWKLREEHGQMPNTDLLVNRTQCSSGSGIQIFNTVDQVINHKRLLMIFWRQHTFSIWWPRSLRFPTLREIAFVAVLLGVVSAYIANALLQS